MSRVMRARLWTVSSLTTEAKVWLACAIFVGLHILTAAAAAYTWVIAGVKFPPFAKYDDGVFLLFSVSFFGGMALFAWYSCGLHERWRK